MNATGTVQRQETLEKMDLIDVIYSDVVTNGPADETGPACRIFAGGETAMEKMELSDSALELIAGRFRLLAEPMRLKILHTLGDAEMSVSELVASTGANQANVSKHLGILLDAGIVARRKEGLKANYRVKDESIFVLCDAVCSRLQTQLEMHKHALSNMRTDRK